MTPCNEKWLNLSAAASGCGEALECGWCRKPLAQAGDFFAPALGGNLGEESFGLKFFPRPGSVSSDSRFPASATALPSGNRGNACDGVVPVAELRVIYYGRSRALNQLCT